VFGVDAYPNIDEKAAALLESRVRNHTWIDGNKRLGWLAIVVFYGLNDITLDAPDDEAYDLVIAMASGIDLQEAAACRWRVGEHRCRNTLPRRGPCRPRTWRTLRMVQRLLGGRGRASRRPTRRGRVGAVALGGEHDLSRGQRPGTPRCRASTDSPTADLDVGPVALAAGRRWRRGRRAGRR
jgi:hypothetical protein